MKKLSVIIFAAAAFIIFSCGKKTEYDFSASSLITLYEAQEDADELEFQTQKWHKSNKKTVVFFGYGYNDPEFVEKTKAKVFQEYGDAEKDGNLIALVFPDDFKHGTRSYTTNLANILDDKEVAGLVVLGAPEGTFRAITRIQDEYNGTLPFPVISLFSQDDILGTEYTSDIVIDKKQKAQLNGILETETEQEISEETQEIIERAVFLAGIAGSPFEKDAKLFNIAKMIAGNAKISRYVDSETGLIPVNHFIMD